MLITLVIFTSNERFISTTNAQSLEMWEQGKLRDLELSLRTGQPGKEHPGDQRDTCDLNVQQTDNSGLR